MGTSTKTFYLDPPQLIGRPNSDGTVTLTPLELKKLNDYNYAVAKMLQGNLNLANLNAETNEVFTDMEGNITTISATADGLAADVSNLEGDLTSLSVTVDGLRIADETGSYTIIDGDKLVSKNHSTSGIVQIQGGSIFLKNGTTTLGEILPSGTSGIYIEAASGKWLYLTGKVQVGMYDTVGINGSTIQAQSDTTLKLIAGTNLSIDSGGTIWIGTSNSYETIKIGDQSGGTSSIYLTGNVYINGVLQ